MRNGLNDISNLYLKFEQEKAYRQIVVRPKMMFARSDMPLDKYKKELAKYLRTRDFVCRACHKRIYGGTSVVVPIISVDFVPEYMLYNEINAVLICPECYANKTMPYDVSSIMDRQRETYGKDFEIWYDGFMKLLAASIP